MDYQEHLLNNGLRIVHYLVQSPVSYCGFLVRVGSRDERSNQFGLAHFMEHMLFKGTQHRKAWHIVNRIERVGGELNAYTTKEETVIYSTFMGRDFNRAVELLSDLVLNSTFPEHEMKKEKSVVIDEMNSYEDTPSDLIYDDFENLLFENHELGHPILGTEESVNQLSQSDLEKFLSDYYRPRNMVFFSTGSVPFKKVVRIVEKYMQKDINIKVARPYTDLKPINPFEITRERKTYQTHLIVGGRAYSMFDSKRLSLFLLNNYLGGPGMNSRLNVLLREKNGWAYQADSQITSYTDTGVFSIYFACDNAYVSKALKIVHKELDFLMEDGLTDSALKMAKRQLKGQLGVQSDQRENNFLGLGKSYMYFNRFKPLEEIFNNIDAITKEDLLLVAREVFAPKNRSVLIYR